MHTEVHTSVRCAHVYFRRCTYQSTGVSSFDVLVKQRNTLIQTFEREREDRKRRCDDAAFGLLAVDVHCNESAPIEP